MFGGLQARASADSQSKLAGEKAALVSTVRSLNRHVAKLEGFKRNLLTSLQASDEVTPPDGRPLQSTQRTAAPLAQDPLHLTQVSLCSLSCQFI